MCVLEEGNVFIPLRTKNSFFLIIVCSNIPVQNDNLLRIGAQFRLCKLAPVLSTKMHLYGHKIDCRQNMYFSSSFGNINELLGFDLNRHKMSF